MKFGRRTGQVSPSLVSIQSINLAKIGKTVIVDLSVKGLKTIKKHGAFAALKKAGRI